MKLFILLALAVLVIVQTSLAKKEVNICGYECSSHAECPPERACISHKCAYPCPGRCGENAVCSVVDHVPACACQPGYTGDPFLKCESQAGVTCPKSWPLVTNGTKKYWIETIKKADWIEAYMFCMQSGRRLATIRTQQEIDDVKSAICKTGLRNSQFWLGGTDHLYENEWVWFPSMEPFTVKDWHLNEPNSDGEDCLEVWERNNVDGYKWNDRPCHERHNFVCEYYE